MNLITFGKKRVVLRAPVVTQSGYGVHSRQIARYLLGKENVELIVQPVPWGVTPWILDHDACDGLIGKLVAATQSNPGACDVSIQVQLPNEWDPNLANVNVGVTAGVETDRCNPEWIRAVNNMDLVIVPSQHVYDVFHNTGRVTTKMVVVNESFIDTVLHPELSADILAEKFKSRN